MPAARPGAKPVSARPFPPRAAPGGGLAGKKTKRQTPPELDGIAGRDRQGGTVSGQQTPHLLARGFVGTFRRQHPHRHLTLARPRQLPPGHRLRVSPPAVIGGILLNTGPHRVQADRRRHRRERPAHALHKHALEPPFPRGPGSCGRWPPAKSAVLPPAFSGRCSTSAAETSTGAGPPRRHHQRSAAR